MRIGMILDTDFPPDPRVENEAITIIDKGFEVFLFCFDYTGNAQKEESIKGIQVRRYHCPRLVYKLSAWAYTFPFYHWITQKWIRYYLKENEIDVVHVHDMQIARAVFNLKPKQSVVLDLHENRPEIMKYYGHLQKFPGKQTIFPKVWEKFESKYIKKADRVVVVTKEAADYYEEKLNINSEHFITLPNTVRAAFRKETHHDSKIVDRLRDHFVILYVGDTGLRRGLLTAIEAVPDLIPQIRNLKLVIVGSNKTDHVLKAKVQELGVGQYVDFEGWQDFTKFQSYIDVSDVCISPLHRNVHHDTTYANKIFQYMALSKSLLVSDCVAQRVVIERAQSGLVHEAENVEDFQEKLLQLYKSEQMRKDFGENGRRFVHDEYSWEITSQGLIDYYKKLEDEL